MRNVTYSLALLWLSIVPLWGQANEIGLQAFPANPLIEVRDSQKLLNFDFAVTNAGKNTLRLSEIEMTVFNPAGEFVTRRTVNSDGLSPGVNIVSKPLLAPGETVDVFNPFYSLARDVPIAKMRYVFRYLVENNDQQRGTNRHRLPMDFDMSAELTVSPQAYETKTSLTMPLHGRILIWEGHDFYAHHRRVPLHDARVQRMGIRANANRYGSDLVISDEQGNVYRNDPWNKKNWFTYGASIYAPADGTVVGTENRYPDNEYGGKKIKYPQAPFGADEDLGNFVMIDHGDGEFSVMPHMLAGSVAVKKGDKVRHGQLVGRVGFSGDAIFPHVHYSLLSCGDIYGCEGLPAYFRDVERLFGSMRVRDNHATLDSGDVVEIEPNLSEQQNSDRECTRRGM
jgi:murein DD-endopeptidase MepM/ murein hydrolase activator NlpD